MLVDVSPSGTAPNVDAAVPPGPVKEIAPSMKSYPVWLPSEKVKMASPDPPSSSSSSSSAASSSSLPPPPPERVGVQATTRPSREIRTSNRVKIFMEFS